MDFSDALRIIKSGGKVARELWREPGLSGLAGRVELASFDGLGQVLVCPGGPYKRVALFSCSQWDILADDWFVVEE